MIESVKPTKDEKHRTIAYSDSEGYTLACAISGESIRFFKVRGGMTYCPLCGNKFGEWGKTER